MINDNNETTTIAQLSPKVIELMRPRHSNKLSKSEAFFYLIYRMTFSPLMISENIIPYKFLTTTYRQLGLVWKWNHETVKAFLDKLQEEGLITISAGPVQSICVNYRVASGSKLLFMPDRL